MSWGLTDKRTFETRTFVRPAKPGERPCLSSYRQHGIQKENNAELTACRPFKVTVVRLSCLSGHRKLWKETSAASCFQAAAKKSGSGLSAFGSFRLRGQKWTRKTGVTPLAFFISEGPKAALIAPTSMGSPRAVPVPWPQSGRMRTQVCHSHTPAIAATHTYQYIFTRSYVGQRVQHSGHLYGTPTCKGGRIAASPQAAIWPLTGNPQTRSTKSPKDWVMLAPSPLSPPSPYKPSRPETRNPQPKSCTPKPTKTMP